jgi:Uma2 family endonuclease
MPTELLEPAVPPPLESLRRKRWTRAEVDLLDSMGIFEGQHYELIEGELINKMGKNRSHGLGVMEIQEWLISLFGFWRVLKEEPIEVASEDNETNRPEPDLAVLRQPSQQLGLRNPCPEDILLAIEVADSTLDTDRSTKAALYARAGIPDYWVLDLNRHRLIVHREPVGGKYTSVVEYLEHESVGPLAAPQSEFRVAAAFRG